MFDNFPPNLNPTSYNLLAVAVAILLVGDLNANEQNSLGNWLLLVGQYLATNAAQQQLIESRIENNNININSKKSKSGGGPFTSPNNKSNQNQRGEVDFLLDSLQRMQSELERLRNNENNSN